MNKYCMNCGVELPAGARFCGACGAPTGRATTPAQRAEPAAPPERTAPPPPAKPTPPAPRRPRPARSQGGRGSNALCIGLALLLVAQTIAVALYGWPGLAVDGGRGKSSTFTLDAGQTVVRTERGAVIDFGPYNGMDGETVTVSELGGTTDTDQGGHLTTYDITVDGRETFDGLLTITLPYDARRTIPGDEEHSVLAQYQNPATGEWELADYTVNTEEKTVTIYTDHLSTFCTVTTEHAHSPYALLARIRARRLDDETALAVLREYEQTGQPGEVTNSLMKEFYLWLMRGTETPLATVGDMSEEQIGLLNDVVGWVTDAGEIALRGGGYDKIGNVLSGVSTFTVGLSTVSLLETMYDAYQGDESSETVAATAYKFAYSAAVSAKEAANAVKLSMLGVLLIDYSLNRFLDEANLTYKDAVFQAVCAYNESLHPRTDAEWYAIILKLYARYKDDPDRFSTALDAIMENFSARYFHDDPEEQFAATNEADLHMYTTGALPATLDAQLYCIDQYKARLGQRLQPVLEDVFKKIQYDGRIDYRNAVDHLRRALNAPLTIEVLENVPDGEKSQYANATISLNRPGGAFEEGWSITLNDEGTVTLVATILGYIQSGVPTELKLWLPGDDPTEDPPTLVQQFQVTQERTVIVLGRVSPQQLFLLVPNNEFTYYGTWEETQEPAAKRRRAFLYRLEEHGGQHRIVSLRYGSALASYWIPVDTIIVGEYDAAQNVFRASCDYVHRQTDERFTDELVIDLNTMTASCGEYIFLVETGPEYIDPPYDDLYYEVAH